MSLDFVDGFDWPSAPAELAEKGWSIVGSPTLVTGRQGGSTLAVRFPDGSTTEKLARPFPTGVNPGASGRLILGFAIKLDSLPTNPNNVDVVEFLAPPSTIGARIDVDHTGTFRLKDELNNMYLTANKVIFPGVWNYVEVIIGFDTASINAFASFQINGASAGSRTGGVGGNVGTNDVADFRFSRSPDEGGNIEFDDVYVGTNIGAAPTSFLGDVSVRTVFPADDDTPTAWTPSAAVTHSELVGEAGFGENLAEGNDGDSSHIETNTAGNQDVFDVENAGLASDAVVHAVVINAVGRKIDPGGKDASGLLKTSTQGKSTNTFGFPTGASFGHGQVFFTQDPAGGSLTGSAVNSMKIGVEAEAS